MKVDGGLQLDFDRHGSVADSARAAAAVGYDRLFAAETSHDPFLALALAAGAADIELGTNIAVAFARNPMTVAMTANDLQQLTGGRFILGLGSQIKAHITRRFSMPWSHPAARMREFILALQAIWESWNQRTRLEFEGEFYRHTLSAPLFDPGPNRFGPPRVFLAAVGPMMTETAGEVADGVICHSFTSASYLSEVTLPALHKGKATAGRTDDIEVCLPVFLATGPAGADLTPEIDKLKKQLAFYASTPAYRGVLEHHGWEEVHTEAHRMSRAHRWDDMAALIDDGMANTLGVVADAATLAEELLTRFGGLVTGLRLNVPYQDAPEVWAPVIAQLQEPTR
ncbi:TIGR03617 family F420-dependent LLM class oxidoreductase [Mycobacterium sp. CPCC 205372]|uniref:TIGR03617 family F420-dependent LLM class oxidoreductase n=1 Tax=Mycobacterium hippophais TaxID=3016340 RepID=A0ABT4PLA9_9MYCO|nr:TIGR03617 family F420-dependent LLM class oxidoreductase [Mycobacterium hippophais]MCZ8377348.1 TIGR03617 family F420-dependent LLM class oxidoreductase [Mycobacterium hippophais]